MPLTADDHTENMIRTGRYSQSLDLGDRDVRGRP